MGSGAISEPSADGVATDAAGGSREPPGGSGRLVPSFGVASPLLLQLTQDQSWLPSIDLYEGPKYYVVVMDVRAPLSPSLRSPHRPHPPSSPLIPRAPSFWQPLCWLLAGGADLLENEVFVVFNGGGGVA